MTAGQLIEQYRLQPHPEGGWYREVHRSERSVGVPAGYPGERSALTIIYFLIAAGDFSAFHRVRSEEVWIHLAGAPLELVVLDHDERLVHVVARAGEAGAPLAVVAADTLQAARSLGEYTLVICLVAPGFDFDDFVIPSREDLLRSHPGHESLIRRFTRSLIP